jgi:hypothetical protein
MRMGKCFALCVVYFFWVVRGVDLQWQNNIPRDGYYTQISNETVIGNARYFQYWWFSSYIPLDEQLLANWPGRAPTAGDRALITTVHGRSDSTINPEVADNTTQEEYIVTVNVSKQRCVDMFIGGDGDQGKKDSDHEEDPCLYFLYQNFWFIITRSMSLGMLDFKDLARGRDPSDQGSGIDFSCRSVTHT